jgi:hypothetical protein
MVQPTLFRLARQELFRQSVQVLLSSVLLQDRSLAGSLEYILLLQVFLV